MPLRSDLLSPIAGDNPAGASLRYDRVYDQIKEARTEEDDSLPSGGWVRQTKKADFRLVTKLAGDALATRSKDLQLAVWLGEALLKQEGISTLAPILRLLLDLQQSFWETIYPEMDEGDAGMRAAPLQWAATRYAKLLNDAALTRKGIGLLEYKAARALGTEAEASSNTAKREAREEAVAAGKLTAEELDDAIVATPKSFYVALDASLQESLANLAELDLFCEERYGDDSPSFRTLRMGLEEVQNLAGSLLREKRRLDPDPVVVPADEAGADPAEEDESLEMPPTPAAGREAAQPPEAAPAPAPRAVPARPAAGGQSSTPQSWDDALQRISGAVSYMATEQPESTLPFLVLNGLRLGELYKLAVNSQLDSLAAPPSELRQKLKRAASDREWSLAHSAALAALATPCGIGWLDLYRYLWTSCDEQGWYTQRNAIANALRQRLRDLPQVASLTLDDDTPSANAETLRWINEEIAPPPPPAESGPQVSDAPPVEHAVNAPAINLEAVLAAERERSDLAEGEDLFVTARGLAAHGQIQGAIQLLARDAAHQSVGRLRFARNLQIAELCLESGNSAVAVPVLQGLIREVEERRLESWEPAESAARPYSLLLQCASVAKLDMQTIFARLCAIDPSAALTMAPPIET